jgi:hypothetical protein
METKLPENCKTLKDRNHLLLSEWGPVALREARTHAAVYRLVHSVMR